MRDSASSQSRARPERGRGEFHATLASAKTNGAPSRQCKSRSQIGYRKRAVAQPQRRTPCNRRPGRRLSFEKFLRPAHNPRPRLGNRAPLRIKPENRTALRYPAHGEEKRQKEHNPGYNAGLDFSPRLNGYSTESNRENWSAFSDRSPSARELVRDRPRLGAFPAFLRNRSIHFGAQGMRHGSELHMRETEAGPLRKGFTTMTRSEERRVGK